MNLLVRPDDIARRRQRLLYELSLRTARAEQSRRGYYDANGVRQGGLIAFVRYFWEVLEPVDPLVEGWPLWAICEHLEAVTFGEITRLLINVPPGFMKSLLTDVFWPAWEWGPMDKAHYRYVAFSYSASLTERDNGRFRDLIASHAFRELWKYRFDLRNKTTLKVINNKTGWKLASSVGGVGTGERGDRVIIDDPHNVTEAESEVVRGETVRWFRESISSRFNKIDAGALIVIMQRVNEDDVSGVILQLCAQGLDYCHLMIPWDFDPARAAPTATGWIDPRYDEDDPDANSDTPAWPERFPKSSIEQLKIALGPYAWAGQYQQSPSPRGGGIFQRAWWQVWESDTGKFPPFDYILASLDSAFTEKEENDPSALTIWGVFSTPSFRDARVDEKTGILWQATNEHRSRIMLVHAWEKNLAFSGPRIDPLPDESAARYKRRTMDSWGLIEWVNDTCNRFKVDKLLIEAKASGISAAQELRNRFGLQDWSVQLCPVKGDKVARALACQPTFSQGLIYAPERDWAERVIDQMAVFPKAKHDDLTDSTTQAIRYLRDVGLAQTDEERHAAEVARATHRPRPAPLYPV